MSPVSLAITLIGALVIAFVLKEYVFPPSRGVRVIPLALVIAFLIALPVTFIEGAIKRRKEK